MDTVFFYRLVEAVRQSLEAAGFSNGNGHPAPLEHALEQPESRVSGEGTNLLKDAKSE